MASANKTDYSHYGGVVRLSNGTVDVLVTTDIGPRVIYYGFCGGTNILAEMTKEDFVETGAGKWHPWGGHRLWTSPEAMPRSYPMDNDPIEFEILEPCAVRVRPAPETAASVQKEMTIALDPTGTNVTLTHTITNIGLWPITLAPWALTIMNGCGTTIFPQEPFRPHTECMLPVRPLVCWSYTDMSDPRWTFGKKFITLKSDPEIKYPQKIGTAVKAGWVAYHREDLLFVKRFGFDESACYPDYGCNFETFTNGSFMEVETVGALTNLEPNGKATHVETWNLFSGVNVGDSEVSLETAIMPLVGKCAGVG